MNKETIDVNWNILIDCSEHIEEMILFSFNETQNTLRNRTLNITNNLKVYPQFKSLLKNYQIEDSEDYILIFVTYLYDIQIQNEHHSYWVPNQKKNKMELLNSLEALIENKNVSITVKAKGYSSKIEDKKLIEHITEVLKKEFIDRGFYKMVEDETIVKITDISKTEERISILDWKRCIDKVIESEQKYSTYSPKKGRKAIHKGLGATIHNIQVYLQKYTSLKADDDIMISKNQISFIFSLFNLFEIVDESQDEDMIRLYLRKYRLEALPFIQDYQKKNNLNLSSIKKIIQH